jgi:hypothetical protein
MRRNEEGEIRYDLRGTEEGGDWDEAIAELLATPTGQSFKTEYRFPVEADRDNADALILRAVHLFPLEDNQATLLQLEAGLRTVIKAKMVRRDRVEAILDEPTLPAPVVDQTPKDKNGRPLTQQQLEWAEMTRFANESTMDAINQRKYVDPKFRAFIATNLRREISEQTVADGVENLNANRKPKTRGVPADVQAFVARYRTTSVAEMKKELSPGINPLGPAAAAESNRLFEAACAANLL